MIMIILGFFSYEGNFEDVVLWSRDLSNLPKKRSTSAGHQG